MAVIAENNIASIKHLNKAGFKHISVVLRTVSSLISTARELFGNHDEPKATKIRVLKKPELSDQEESLVESEH